MLELHRASAGSGKTYTLAKKYIWYLITIKGKGGRRRLRTFEELLDSARHILAVTFTNKATAEMQQRIVDRLFDLATITPVTESRNGKTVYSKPDYMGDFVHDLGESPQNIAKTCSDALSILLERYSDFNVSTIDSFFQSVLRTLAYESDLNDTFQVEIDSGYLSKVAVDATLEEIDNNTDDKYLRYWIKTLMHRDKKGWQMFTRQSDGWGSNVYGAFLDSVNKLANEDYKLIRSEVEEYFRTHDEDSFIRLYEDLIETYEKPVKLAFERMVKAYRKAFALVPDDMKGLSRSFTAGKLSANVRDFAAAKPDNFANEETYREFYEKCDVSVLNNTEVIKKYFDGNAEATKPLANELAECEKLYLQWHQKVISPEFRHWMTYAVNLPYLALFSIVTRKRLEFLEESNLVELGETNMILRSIIGDSDAPFIYERLGTVLNHFLIDEFQDTSRLQWDNLKPLLEECMTRDDSLIIGDAKQSIYRFRNADPSLITTVVPDNFTGRLREYGSESSENTNYRSLQRVVQFNNSFFEFLAHRLDEPSLLLDNPGMLYAPLYSNVVQNPADRSGLGYVRVEINNPDAKDFNSYVLSQIPTLVASLISRGYAQKDIAVLVPKNDQSAAVINRFVEYNATCEKPDDEIRFVSEESLKVASSRSVRLIVGVLENMARGFDPILNEKKERNTKGLGKWRDIESSFKFFAMRQPDKSMAQLVEEFIETQPDMQAVTDLLSSLQSLAIPAIVEAVVASFLPEEMRRKDAVYIAAFQDLVLEYCDRYPTDIGSFLQWWERKSISASITSPAETDAVQVLTIHKSKGLEFDCVIVPFANWNMNSSACAKHTEWRWVQPDVLSHPEIDMPPYLPVLTTRQLLDTSHQQVFSEFVDKVRMDYLNAAYVAFTRAAKELYVFCKTDSADIPSSKPPKKNSSKELLPADSCCKNHSCIGRYLYEFVKGLGTSPVPGDPARVDRSAFCVTMPENDEENLVATYGEPVADVAELKKDKRMGTEMLLIDDYHSVVPSLNKLKYREGDALVELEPDDDEEDLDPRSEGNVKHAILEYVDTPGDLHRAVRHVMLQGLVTRSIAAELETELAAKLAECPHSHWFDGSAKVITERALLRQGRVSRRPDRILLYDDGHVEVVDYKFGKVDTRGRHRRQVLQYMRLLAQTGLYSNVSGFLWYVNEDTIVPVTPDNS